MRPSSGVPTPIASFTTSVARMPPTCTHRAPSTPTCAQVGGSPSVPTAKRSLRTTGSPSGGPRPEDRDLRVPLADGSPYEGEPHRLGGGRDGATRSERVARVDHDVGTREELLRVVVIEACRDRGDDGDGRQCRDGAHGALGLVDADVFDAVRDLALQVVELDGVVVDHGDGTDARGGEGQDRGRPDAAGADDGDARVRETPLPLVADALENGVASGPPALVGIQLGHGIDQGAHVPSLRRSGCRGIGSAPG